MPAEWAMTASRATGHRLAGLPAISCRHLYTHRSPNQARKKSAFADALLMAETQQWSRQERLVGLTWYSMLGSLRLLRQMAHVSAQMSQDHIATAFHFLISNRGATCNTHATRSIKCHNGRPRTSRDKAQSHHAIPCHSSHHGKPR